MRLLFCALFFSHIASPEPFVTLQPALSPCTFVFILPNSPEPSVSPWPALSPCTLFFRPPHLTRALRLPLASSFALDMAYDESMLSAQAITVQAALLYTSR